MQVGPPHIGGGSPLSGGWEGQASCPPNPPLRGDFSHLSGGWKGQASVRRQIVIIVINFNIIEETLKIQPLEVVIIIIGL